MSRTENSINAFRAFGPRGPDGARTSVGNTIYWSAIDASLLEEGHRGVPNFPPRCCPGHGATGS